MTSLVLDTPRSRRLNTNEKSNVLFYLTGHGGENFLKFQDDEEINAFELADAFEQMKQKKRYNELMFIGITGLNLLSKLCREEIISFSFLVKFCVQCLWLIVF